jgi:SAM-dependent methyltransferase
MKEIFKNILKGLHIYHSLQSFYRGIIFSILNKKYRWQYKKYAGSGFTCNVCAAVYSQFVPDYPAMENKAALDTNRVIAGYGKNILCPNCLSTARERLVIALLTDKFSVQGKKILHLSPEKNIYEFLRSRASVITADLLPGFYKTIDGLVLKEDATKFSFSDKLFDIIIGNHILEHIPDDRKAMKEIYRVLKPGGRAVLQVPYSESIDNSIETPGIDDPSLQSKLYGQEDHVRIYNLNDYVLRLQQAGFFVEVISYKDLQAYYPFAIQEGESFLMIKRPA